MRAHRILSIFILALSMPSSIQCAGAKTAPAPQPSPSVSAPEVSYPIIAALAGQAVSVIGTPEGFRDPEVGMVLLPGYVVRTGIRAALKIQYPDGSVIIVGGKSDFMMKPDQDQSRFIGLKRGILRVMSPGGQAIHLETRFGTFTLPARAYGSDSIIEIRFRKDDENPKIKFWEGSAHALGGQIQFEGGLLVPTSHFIQVREEGKFTKPLAFDRVAYSKILAGQQPELQKLAPEIPPLPRVEVDMIPQRSKRE